MLWSINGAIFDHFSQELHLSCMAAAMYFIFTYFRGQVCVFLIAGVFYSNLALKMIIFVCFNRLIASKLKVRIVKNTDTNLLETKKIYLNI